ncbi:MAG: hypothetical protein IPL01_00950 [Acidobacteria bacterium]|nr:hypothetical protein [Acidobacteriota bacterium]MBK9706856.1 hypothetical protein [Acidobacteriota bacterium]
MMRKIIFSLYTLTIIVGAGLIIEAQAQTCLPPIMQQAPKKEAQAQAQEEKVPDDRISIKELKRKMDCREDMVIIDSRAGTALIGSAVRIKGAIHITLDDLAARLSELPKNKEIIIYCT